VNQIWLHGEFYYLHLVGYYLSLFPKNKPNHPMSNRTILSTVSPPIFYFYFISRFLWCRSFLKFHFSSLKILD
jgi:hypothetical protein